MDKLTETIRLRLFFRTGEADRQICWFQMTGDEFYLGGGRKNSLNLEPVKFSGKQVTITIPDSVDIIKNAPLKASFHESGQFHVKTGKKYSGDPEQWPTKQQIKEPFRVASLITCLPTDLDVYERSLTRRSSHAVVIPTTNESVKLRHYFEFFLTPPGQFEIPQPMIKMAEIINDQPYTQSMNENLILAIRHFVFSESMRFHEWQPEKSVWLFARELTELTESEALDAR